MASSDYISREDASEAVEGWGPNDLTEAILADIKTIPAADVRPAVKANWVYTNMSRLVCSNCGNPVAFALKEDGWYHGDFCPKCGADMREER